jgi:ribosomal-protein-alanine N-acetyltransferase
VSVPVLMSARLELRPVAESDLAWLHAFNILPDVRQYLFDDETWSEDDVRVRLIERNAEMWRMEGLGLFIVTRREEATPIGWCGLWYFHEPPVREVCYAIHPDHWGQGYAQEAVAALLAWAARAKGVDTFLATVDDPNDRSQRLLLRLGFTETHRSPGPRFPLRHYARGAEGLVDPA